MGEAKRRKMLAEQGGFSTPTVIDRALVSQAVRKVVGALTSYPAADCSLYALVGAGLLNHLGIRAQAVAGSAVWRVGPGNGDIICHAPEAHGQTFVPELGNGQSAALFHAWIRIERTATEATQIVDLTTFQLAKKAREMDALDGGRTEVRFCPDSIWAPEALHAAHPRSIVQSFETGVFSYVRKPPLEAIVFNPGLRESATHWAAAALVAYRNLEAGSDLRVMGVDEDGSVSEADESASLNLRRRHP